MSDQEQPLPDHTAAPERKESGGQADAVLVDGQWAAMQSIRRLILDKLSAGEEGKLSADEENIRNAKAAILHLLAARENRWLRDNPGKQADGLHRLSMDDDNNDKIERYMEMPKLRRRVLSSDVQAYMLDLESPRNRGEWMKNPYALTDKPDAYWKQFDRIGEESAIDHPQIRVFETALKQLEADRVIFGSAETRKDGSSVVTYRINDLGLQYVPRQLRESTAAQFTANLKRSQTHLEQIITDPGISGDKGVA